MTDERPQGPNVKRLAVRRMSRDAIPPGGTFLDGINFLTSPHLLVASAKNAVEWVFKSIDEIKSAPDNKWGDDDEVIAGEILKELERVKTK